MGYIFPMMVFVLASGVISRATEVYDFEGDSVPSEITPPLSLDLSTIIFKKRSKSLKWQWNAGQRLALDLSSKDVQVESNAGIQIWIHNSKSLTQKCLSLCVRQKRSSVHTDSCFSLSLNFKGWRAAWVQYSEFLGCPLPSTTESLRGSQNYDGTIDQFVLIAPSDVASPSILHIDFLQFADKISIATRDLIVPPLTYVRSTNTYCTSCRKIHSGLLQEDALLRNSRKSFWQQIYRWSLLPPYPATAPAVDAPKMQAINEITQRLMNWYANENTAFTIIPHQVSPGDSFLKHRWDDLVSYFDSARRKYTELTKIGSDTPTSGLFTRNDKSKSRGGKEEFSFVHSKVLLPLTLEFHLKSRPIEVEHVACEIAKKYSCDSANALDDEDIKAITGTDNSLKTSFRSSYSSFTSISEDMHPKCPTAKQDCVEHVKTALDNISNIRKTKVMGLFNYLKDQGLDKGSALGTMDHELIQMTGFLHSVFLMREHLTPDIIDTMKWYVEFGEVYQTTFEYKGSTADRIRSAMLYRLMTVIAMPQDNDVQKREKIRDMDALKKWFENALSLTEGLSGLIKPDYTCFHHKTFYASAYCPQALHTAALVSYLLEETAYKLTSEVKENVINALKVLRIAAVRYSSPSQVGGRFPSYNKAVLAEDVPAYAYMAMKTPLLTDPNIELAQVRMFLRLYQPDPNTNCVGVLNSQLCKGTPSRIYYLNTLGSLEIMERVKSLASTHTTDRLKWFYRAEDSPSGHFTKQFGALSIHRRDDWAVTVKGFDKYVWDFESGKDNIYGMYGSHGAMLIANSEAALTSKNIEQGWDWRKIPGSTVINSTYEDMAQYGEKSSRQYNPSENAMAGGVFLKGSGSRETRNGVFGMDFKQPSYTGRRSDSSPFFNVDFSFKKSVYFYDDIVVSLGSNIRYTGGTYEIHTTLFQDLMEQTSSPVASGSAANIFDCKKGAPMEYTSWLDIPLAVLVDVNGNRYYIPNPDDQGLVLHRYQRQDSFMANKKPKVATHGMYCTAWFNHGTNPSGATARYEYAVEIDPEPQKSLLVPQNRYDVVKQGRNVHVVHFKEHSNRGNVYGYVVFPKAPTAAVNVGRIGPIESVLHQSVMMVEEKTQPKGLYISVSSPQLKLQKKDGSPPWCQSGTTTPLRSSEVDETLLYCSKSTGHPVHVNLRNKDDWSQLQSLHVGGKDKFSTVSTYLDPTGAPTTSPLKFINLRNGAETEVAFQ